MTAPAGSQYFFDHDHRYVKCLSVSQSVRKTKTNFSNQDVVVSSPQPEPIDDIAGMRPAPPGREAPCDVQLRYRYGARDLMLPSHLMLSSDGATPRSQGRELMNKIVAANGKQSTV